MKTDSLTSQLKEHALSHGIDLIGITSAKPFVRQGREQEIIDPKEMLPDAQAVIVTAFHMNEAIGGFPIDKDPPRGRFSQYSVRAFSPLEDYHIGIIQGFLEKHGYEAVPNQDEWIPMKLAAARAGLGKYGKNAVILTEEYGSYVMFATVVTNAPLVFEDMYLYASDCGTCDLCLKSCPTGAIYEPYKINRRQCITEWLWGTFAPIDLREKQENRLFGCEECTQVCPRNKKFAPREAYPVKIDDVSSTPELIPLVTGSEEYYRKNIASFPLRAGVDAIRGNVIIALGNIQTKEAIDPLCRTIEDPNPQIRAYSAWSLGRIGSAKAQRGLENALKMEGNEEVRNEIQHALGG
jgi:epoxyqueuosine reductase